VSDPSVTSNVVHLLQAFSSASFAYSCAALGKISADIAVSSRKSWASCFAFCLCIAYYFIGNKKVPAYAVTGAYHYKKHRVYVSYTLDLQNCRLCFATTGYLSNCWAPVCSCSVQTVH